jgi:Mg-chelatase subunit ChlD
MSRFTRSALVLASLAGLAAAQVGGPAGWCGTVIPAQPGDTPVIQGPVTAFPAERGAAQPSKSATPRVEVVFVLDTTGSMGGLIEGAKQTIWSIANAIATGEPHPDISMGLVGYRDRGDDYITTVTGLTADLDAVYSTLMGFSAGGGGDGPESVNQALHEAITKIEWSGDDTTLRMIYLVGDAEPHMDYDQDVPYTDSARLAAERGIIINTIQCGSSTTTADVWQQIARAAEGEYFAIAQDGGVAVIATPFDADLSRLGAELGQTVIGYGDAAVQREQAGRRERAAALDEAAPAPAAAERALYNASGAGEDNLLGRQELVQAVQDGSVKLEDIPAEQLPENMRDMSVRERAEYIEQQAARRAAVQEQINELGRQRQAFLDQARAEAAGEGGFDQKVIEALRRQAARFGIEYKEAEPGEGR